ncbi:MAG: DUF2953 domain-containing protein [Ruminococcaceae bacterium]|nr:DUF2953 domain-containing protein [Oscillospiraceae bacterium]
MTAVIIIAAIALLIFFLLASFITAYLEYDGVFKYKVKYLCFTLAKNPLSPEKIKKNKLKEEKKKRKKEKKELKEKAKRDKLLAKKRKKRSKTAVPVKCTETAAQTEEKTEKNTDTKETAKTGPQSDTETKKVKADGKDNPKKDGNAGKPKITPELIFRMIGKAKPHIKRIFKKIRISGVYFDATVGGEDAAKAAISYGVHCAAINGLTAFLDNTVSFKAEKINIRADFDLEKSEYYGRAKIKLRLSTLLHSGIWGFFAVVGELKEVSDITEKSENKESPQKAA